MKYHSNTNSGYRRIKKQISACLCRFYRNGVPQEQIKNNGQNENKFVIFDATGKIISFEPVPIKSSTGEKGKLVAHYGLPPEALPYLALFS